MKKKMYRIMAAAFAASLVIASPIASMTTHAIGFDADAGENTEGGNGERPPEYNDPDWDGTPVDSGSNGNDSSSNEPSDSEPSGNEPSGNEPSDSEPSGSETSGNEPSDSEPSGSETSGNESSGNSGSSNSSSSSNSNSSSNSDSSDNGSSYQQTANDKVISVPGGQKFRSVMNDSHTVYQVYHCGINRAAFKVADAKGNAVAFSTVTLEIGGDGRWYLNIACAQGVDTDGFTVSVTKGDASYLSGLGVSGIKLNGTVALLTADVK